MSASNLMLGKLQGRAHTRSQPSPAAALAEHPGTLLCFAVPGGLGNAVTLGNRGDSLSTLQTNLGHLTSQGVEPPCAWPRASAWPSPSWFTAWLCLAPEGSRSAFRQWRPRAAQPDLGALWKAPATLPQILTWWNRDTSTLWGSTETKPKPFSCEIILLICCFFSPSVLPTSSHTLSTTSSSVASASCKRATQDLPFHLLCASHSSVKWVWDGEGWRVGKGGIIKQLGKFTWQCTNGSKDNFFLSWSLSKWGSWEPDEIQGSRGSSHQWEFSRVYKFNRREH